MGERLAPDVEPADLRRILTAPVGGWRDRWNRVPCPAYTHRRRTAGCTDITHYHWSNGDRTRPWRLLWQRGDVIDADRLRRIRSDYRRRRR